MAPPKDDVSEEGAEAGIDQPEVVTKYKMASDIANAALKAVAEACVVGASVVDLCNLGDKLIMEKTATVFNKKSDKGKVEKGVAFPTCISINHCVCNNSPLALEGTQVLVDDDVVKIDLGCHIDGYIAIGANTIVVGATEAKPTTGAAADVIAAVHAAADIAHRLIRPGKKNSDISAAVAKVAEEFGVNVLEGLMSHQMKKFVIDGDKVILSKPNAENKVEEFEFEIGDVFAIDIAMSTGAGKPKESDARTTVFKRAIDQTYGLKLKASRSVFNEIKDRFSVLPFTLRAFNDTGKNGVDEKKARLGIVECVNHQLVHPYPVLYEKDGDITARFSFTVLVTSSNSLKITDTILPPVKTDKKIKDEELLEIMKMSTNRKKSKKNKKKNAKKAEE